MSSNTSNPFTNKNKTVYFYQLNTGAIWASETKIALVTKRKIFVGKCYKVKSIGAAPDMEHVYEVGFPKKALACAWNKFEPELEEGQLFGKENPNLHPKDKKKKNG